jgi:hypothetical protein
MGTDCGAQIAYEPTVPPSHPLLDPVNQIIYVHIKMKALIKYVIWWLLPGILLAACSKTTYYSRIESSDLIAKAEQYEISLQPSFKEYGLDNPTLRGFILNLRNHSEKDLQVVWKDTRFILNGEDENGFVFPDTDPKFRQMAKRPSVVPPGGRLREAIFPVNFASYISGWHHSTLPDGELGVLITLQVDEETITEMLTLHHVTNIK